MSKIGAVGVDKILLEISWKILVEPFNVKNETEDIEDVKSGDVVSYVLRRAL